MKELDEQQHCARCMHSKKTIAGGGNTIGNVNVQAEAEKILQSLESDVELVPSNIADWWINYLHSHYQRYLDTLSFLDKNDMKRKILEIGSVPGHFTVLLKRLGYNVRGVDIDPTRGKQFWINTIYM